MTARQTKVEAAGEPAAVGLAVTLWLLAGARLVHSFRPDMWGWGLSGERFVAPWAGWALWALPTVLLVPALARRAGAVLARGGRAVIHAPGVPRVACAAVAAGLVLALPDRVRFVGDFLIRQGSVETARPPGVLFPQALPLDVFLHYRLPLFLSQAVGLGANSFARGLGAVEAALLAWLALEFARALKLRGAAAAAAAGIVFFGGYLGLFTGYSKAFSEMCLVTAWAGVAGVRAAREGRCLASLALALAAGLFLHRGALLLVPGAAFALVAGFRRPEARERRRRPATLAALGALAVALGIMVPRIVGIFLHVDVAAHLSSSEVQAGGGLLRSALAGTRGADLLNLLVYLSPLSPAVPVLLAGLAARRALPAGAPGRVLALFALPALVSIALVHPVQGLFRDWDAFSAPAVSLSLFAAWLVGETLTAAPRLAWLAAPALLAAAAPSVLWLVHDGDRDRGYARVAAFLEGPPARSEGVRARALDFLGGSYFQLGRYGDAARAFAAEAELAPTARTYLQWALSAANGGDLVAAREAYRRMVVASPDAVAGWQGLGTVAWRLRDFSEALRAAKELLRL